MALMTTKRALIALCGLSAFAVAAYYHALLSGKASTYDMHLQDPLLVRSESGRLVARSQVNFYKIVEQWVHPEGRTNLSAMRKERLIENRRVVREEIEYGEKENEYKRNVAQEHRKLLSNNSSLNKQMSDIEAKQDSLRKGQWKTHYSNHQQTVDLLGTNRSAQNRSMTSTKTNEHRWQQQEMTDINNHKLVNDGKKSLQLDGRAVIDESNSSQVSVYTTKGRSSEFGNGSKLKKSSAQKVEFENVPMQRSVKAQGKWRPSFESRLQRVTSKNSTHMSDGESVNLHAQLSMKRDSEAEKFQVKQQPSPEPTRVKSDDGASKNSTKAHMAQIKEFTKPLPQQYKKSDIEYQNATKFRTKHQPSSKLTQMESPYIVSKKGNIEHRALPSSKIDVESYNVSHIPVKQTASESAKRGASLKNSMPNVVHRESRMPRAQPYVKSHSETENIQQQFGAESTRMKSRVMSKIATNNNHYEYYKSRSNPAAKVDDTGANPAKVVHVKHVSSYGQRAERVIKIGGSKQIVNTSRGANPAAPPLYIGSRERVDTNINSDPRYAHLPESVKKKLIKINKDRARRIKFLKLITRRCEGQKYCLARVARNERYLHDECLYKAIKLEDKGTELNKCKCKLLRAPTTKVHGRIIYTNITFPRVALVSLPGSGNTWVRGLLEQVTGYCTGSMWCDPMLRARQFCAEGIRTNTLVIKNHDPTIRWDQQKLPVNASQKGITSLNKPTFNSAIFIHRDPYDATVAEWNRALGKIAYNATKNNRTIAGIGFYNVTDLTNQHTVSFGKEAFGTNPGWNTTIYTQMENWEAMINHFLINNTVNRPVLLVKYEDLKKDTYLEVERMVNFLDVKFPTSDVNKMLVRDGFHTFHRNHTYTFDHYTTDQKRYVNSVISRVAKQLQLHNIDYLRVEKYLRHT